MGELTKSIFLQGLQCGKLLWHATYKSELLTPPSEGDRFKMQQGTEVGFWARKRFPNGEPVREHEHSRVLTRTQELLKLNVPLFEAGFRCKHGYARVDILNPTANGWDIIEVKSSTEVKEEHIPDAAFQYHVLTCAGLKVNKCFLMHLNNEYVRHGEIDVEQLFTLTDVTFDVSTYEVHVKDAAKRMELIMAAEKSPEVPIGPYCDKPNACPMKHVCWGHLPKHHAGELYYLGKKKFDFIHKYGHIANVPVGELDHRQQIQQRTVVTGVVHTDGKALKKFTSKIVKPISYLDFETFQTAVPMFNNSKPWQQIPFQYSLHIENDSLRHCDFLYTGNSDPRLEFLESLRKCLPETGTIIAHNAPFEIGRLKDLAEQFPDYADWIQALIPRFVDTIEPFRAFAYYHPEQRGSCSIKKIMPAMFGKSYDDLEIGDGGAASREYFRVTYGNCLPQEKERVYKHLLTYCCQDTQAMIDVVNALRASL